MTVPSTAPKPGDTRAGYLLLVTLLAVAAVVYWLQADLQQTFVSTYPEVVPPIAAKFNFLDDEIRIRLSRDPTHPRIVVFAYDDQGRQVAILKPIHNRGISIGRGELADYRVDVNRTGISGYQVLKKNYGVTQDDDFYRCLTEARAAGRSFGVQECLYPACTMCLDVCPVIADGIIKMPRLPDGRFHPVILHGGCPRCGKCFELCKLGVIFKTDLRRSITPEFLKNGNIDDPSWDRP